MMKTLTVVFLCAVDQIKHSWQCFKWYLASAMNHIGKYLLLTVETFKQWHMHPTRHLPMRTLHINKSTAAS